MIGIYKITSPKNIIYIGQSINIAQRFKQHKYSINSKKKLQKDLYESYFKYGFNNHIFEVIHEFKFKVTQEVLDEYEDLYIKRYIELGFMLFNKKSGGVLTCKLTEDHKKSLSKNFPNDLKERYTNERSGELNYFFGKTHSDKTRKVMSEKKLGKYLGDKNPKAKAIIQYDLNMNLIAEFSTINEAAEKLGISRQSINGCCGEWNKTAHGFIWRYKIPKVKVA